MGARIFIIAGILIVIAFFLGVSVGFHQALNLGIKAVEQFVDIKLNDKAIAFIHQYGIKLFDDPRWANLSIPLPK